MKLTLSIIFLLLFSSAWAQKNTEKKEEISFEEVLEDSIKTVLWCEKVESLPVWKDCYNDSIGDLVKCTYQSMTEFIQSNFKIPYGMCCSQGTIFLSFIVDEDGNVAEIEVIKGIHKRLDSAAVEAVKKLPSLYPGTERGRKVKVKFFIPVRLKLT